MIRFDLRGILAIVLAWLGGLFFHAMLESAGVIPKWFDPLIATMFSGFLAGIFVILSIIVAAYQ